MLTKWFNSALLNFEEMYTFLLQIKACLNFMSFTELSDPSDLNALTPAHFLISRLIHQFSEPLQETKAICLGERWHLIQKTSSTFLEQLFQLIFTWIATSFRVVEIKTESQNWWSSSYLHEQYTTTTVDCWSSYRNFFWNWSDI